MANDSTPELIARPGGSAPAASGAQGVLQRFQGLPRPMQAAVIVVGLIFVFYVVSSLRGGGQQAVRPTVNMGVPGNNGGGVSATFTGIDTDRPALMNSVYEQNRRDMTDLRNKIETGFSERDQALQSALSQNQELQRQMQQMMGDFTSELKNVQLERSRDNERLAQLADQQKQLELNAPVDGATGPSPVGVRRRAIAQVSLGGGPVAAITRPLQQVAASNPATHLTNSGLPEQSPGQQAAAQRLPFMPPIGFVHGVLLNGVDALVGGSVTPALVRMSGTYKTAMNTTVTLDGCFAMVEFEGNISTERATGKPSRMTCVYPDNGAASYSLSGYVVDADDGIIGVPGVLYEGDPTRIAAAMLADFAAGVGDIVAQNQQTTTVNSDGTQQTALTGSQGKAQVAGGVNKAMSSLSTYLQNRVSRVQSFIRLDATREINMVILNGTELRHEGNVWSDLFDADTDGGTPPSQLPASAQQGQPNQSQQPASAQ